MLTLEERVSAIEDKFIPILDLDTLANTDDTEFMALSRTEGGVRKDYKILITDILEAAGIEYDIELVSLNGTTTGESYQYRLIEALNARSTYTVSRNRIYEIVARYRNGNTYLETYIHTAGLGVFGSGGVQLSQGKYAKNVKRIDATQEVGFGDANDLVVATNIEDSINDGTIVYDTKVRRVFRRTISGDVKVYAYLGAAEFIGKYPSNVASVEVFDTDFEEISSEDDVVPNNPIPDAGEVFVDGYLDGYVVKEGAENVDGHLRGISSALQSLYGFLGLDIEFDTTNLAYHSGITGLLNSALSRINGKSYYVNDASADVDVTSGSAIYKYTGTTGVQGAVTLADDYERFTYTASGGGARENPSFSNTLTNEIKADAIGLDKYFIREIGGNWSFTKSATGNIDKCFFLFEVDKPLSMIFSSDFINENQTVPDTQKLVKVIGYYEAADDKFYYSVLNNSSDTDVTAPTLESATVEPENDDQIILTYSENLNSGSVPVTSDFTPSGGKTVTNVSISGTTVTLTVNSSYLDTDTITISYTSGTNPIEDVTGNEADDLSSEAVVNNVGNVEKSASLNGTDGFISITNTGSMALTGSFSIQFLIKVANDTYPHRFINKGDGTSGNYDFSIGHNGSGELYLQVKDTTNTALNQYTFAGSAVTVADGWTKVHFRFDSAAGTASSGRLWVDDVEDASVTPVESASFVQMRNVANIEVGRRIDLSQYSEFLIDNLKIWNTAEDSTTVAAPEREYQFNDDFVDSGTDGTDATGTNVTFSTDVI